MFGFVLGAVCLMGLGAMARRRRYWRHYGYGYGPGMGPGMGPGCGRSWGHGPMGGWGGHGGGWAGPTGSGSGYGDYEARSYAGAQWRGRWWRGGMAMMMRRLQLTPDQQTVVREELEQLMHTMQEHRAEWSDSRRDVAQAIRGESFDATVMGELFGRHDERLTEARKAVMEALGRIHAVLDETQRARLAEMLDRGAGTAWHPFRGDAA